MAKIEIEIVTERVEGSYVPEYRSMLRLFVPVANVSSERPQRLPRVFYTTMPFTGTGAAEGSQEYAIRMLGRALSRLINMTAEGGE